MKRSLLIAFTLISGLGLSVAAQTSPGPAAAAAAPQAR